MNERDKIIGARINAAAQKRADGLKLMAGNSPIGQSAGKAMVSQARIELKDAMRMLDLGSRK